MSEAVGSFYSCKTFQLTKLREVSQTKGRRTLTSNQLYFAENIDLALNPAFNEAFTLINIHK